MLKPLSVDKQKIKDLEDELSGLKKRTEHDENAWMKYVETANRQHADSLNQLGDLFRLVQGLTQKLDKLEKELEHVRNIRNS